MVGAEIVVDLIAVIAFLGELLDAVTTTRGAAFVGASVCVDLIAVVAFLDAGTHNTITAARNRAGVGAGVCVDPVAVVAGFATAVE